MNGVKLTKPQTRFLLSKHKYTLFLAGFGAGKSEGLFYAMLITKINHPDVDVAYFAPSYQLIRDIAFGRIQNILDNMGLQYNLNKAESNLYINGYGRILFRTMDNPDRIVGYEVFASFIDELDTMRIDQAENAWNKIIARNRQKDHNTPGAINKIYVATTPEGYRFCYQRWGRPEVLKDENSPYYLIKAPTYSNPYLPDDYIDSLRATYPANLIDAYIEGEFVNLNSKTVYPNFDRVRNHLPGEIQPRERLYVGCDFNVMNMNAIVHRILPNGKPHAVAELIRLADTPAMIEALQMNFEENELHIYPDANAKGRKSTDASVSDITLLREAGFKIHARSKNPPIKNRIQSMNAAFYNGKEEVNYYVDTEKCPAYTDALEQQTFDANGVPLKDPTTSIDDINDAAGYYISYEFPVHKTNFTTKVVSLY